MAETITAAAYHDGLPQKTEVDGRERVIVNDSGTDKTITAEVLRDYAAKEVGERVDTLQTLADANSDGLNKLAVWEAEATETGVTVQTRSAMSQTAAHSVEIPAATTTGAGVMTAKQAASLESAASTADKAWQQSNTNKTDIAAETAARKQGDADLLSQMTSTAEQLDKSVKEEAETRLSQITTTAEQLDKSIKEEAEYRLTQDTALQSQITQNKTDISANAAAIAAISKEQLFRDMWAAVGGKWTEAAGYSMNGLTLTYSEAVAVYAQTAGAWKSASALLENGMYHSLKCRTNIPITSPISRKTEYLFHASSGLEVAAISAINLVTSVTNCFRYCTSLVKVDGVLNLKAVSTFTNNFYNCPKLAYLRLQGLKVSADLSGAPALDYDSVRYLVDNAVNTAAITVTVGDELYAVINGTAQPTEARGGTAEEWAQLLADATQGRISFAKK